MTRVVLPDQATRVVAPPHFDGAEEVGWACVSLFKEDPGRSFREIARTAGTTHPTAAKLIREWQADRKAVEDYLASKRFLV